MGEKKHKMGLVLVFALSAAFLFAVLGVMTKVALAEMPSAMVVFFRQAFSLATLAPLIIRDVAYGRPLKTQRLHLHVLRCGSALAAMYALFYALHYLPVVDAVVLSYTRPLFVPFVVWLWMGRRLAAKVWIGLLIGFVGVVCVVHPTGAVFNWAAVAALASGLFGALAFTATRKLAKRESATTLVLYFLLYTLPVSAIPLYWSWVWPSWEGWVLLGLIGLLATFYQIFIAIAYRYGQTSKVAAILYSTVAFALALDWLVWGQGVDLLSLLGIALISLGCLVVVRDKRAASQA